MNLEKVKNSYVTLEAEETYINNLFGTLFLHQTKPIVNFPLTCMVQRSHFTVFSYRMSILISTLNTNPVDNRKDALYIGVCKYMGFFPIVILCFKPWILLFFNCLGYH